MKQRFTKLDDNDNEVPITNSDIEINTLASWWLDEKHMDCCMCKTKGVRYVLTDLTGAFSGEEGSGSQFYFDKAKCVKTFLREIGLTKTVPSYTK